MNYLEDFARLENFLLLVGDGVGGLASHALTVLIDVTTAIHIDNVTQYYLYLKSPQHARSLGLLPAYLRHPR